MNGSQIVRLGTILGFLRRGNRLKVRIYLSLTVEKKYGTMEGL